MSGYEINFHTFKLRDGRMDADSIERELQQIETKIGPIFKLIRQQKTFDSADWLVFHTFLGLMYVRVPHFINTLHKFMLQLPLEGTNHRDFSLLTSLQSADVPFAIFSRMRWRFLVNSGNSYYITGDNPVSYAAPTRKRSIYPPGLADQDIEVTFPVSRTVCALGTWHNSTTLYQQVGGECVDTINARTYIHAERYVYAPCQNAPDFSPD